MMMHKRLQKVLAIALMTSFFSTSFIMGVSEAAPARHAGGQRPAQTQQVRPVQKSSSGHQARQHTQQGTHRQQSRPMQKSSGHQGPVMHKSAPNRQGTSIHKNAPNRQGTSIHKNAPQHKGGTIHQGPGMRNGHPMSHKGGSIHHGPATHRGDSHHKGQPMMHKGGPSHGGPVVVQQHHPAPPHHHHDDGYRSMHSSDWLGALIVGGIIGAIIANNNHRANTAEYAEVY
jgi:hypothetical protein